MSADDVRGEEYEAAKYGPHDDPCDCDDCCRWATGRSAGVPLDSSPHLPECEVLPGPFIGHRAGCICDRLRACEQRILLSKPNIELSAVYGYEAGRVDGIAAAREAMSSREELAEARLLGYREGYYEGVQAAREAVAAVRTHKDLAPAAPRFIKYDDALAAIDGLTAHDSSDIGTKVPGGAT